MAAVLWLKHLICLAAWLHGCMAAWLHGCMADGKTIDEALHEVQDAMQPWIKTAQELGDPIPRASVAENYSGQWRIRVPKHLHASLALQAKAEGVSLNMLAATLLAEGVGKKTGRWGQQ